MNLIMKKKTKTAVFIAESAAIAAIYAVMCIVVSPLSYGMVQCRIAEALCVLCAFTPTAIYGLTVGCLIANIFSFNPVDMLFGTAATLIAAILAYLLRNVKTKGVAWLVPLPAVMVNMAIIGLELQVYFPMENSGFLVGYLIQAAAIGIGQVIACYGLGIPLYIFIDRTRIKKIITE